MYFVWTVSEMLSDEMQNAELCMYYVTINI